MYQLHRMCHFPFFLFTISVRIITVMYSIAECITAAFETVTIKDDVKAVEFLLNSYILYLVWCCITSNNRDSDLQYVSKFMGNITKVPMMNDSFSPINTLLLWRILTCCCVYIISNVVCWISSCANQCYTVLSHSHTCMYKATEILHIDMRNL